MYPMSVKRVPIHPTFYPKGTVRPAHVFLSLDSDLRTNSMIIETMCIKISLIS